MKFNAYHFVGKTLRNGSPVPPDGETLRWNGDLIMCQSGLHASRKAWQALEYAPGHTLCRVHCAGKIIAENDKIVCRERTIISRIDTSVILWAFARKCALDVAHLWECPPVVLEYLEAGDEAKRDAARAAARDAAWAAAWDAAGAAAWDAAGAAARAAARDATWDATWAAARAAARAATWAAAGAAAKTKQRRRFTRMVNAAFAAK